MEPPEKKSKILAAKLAQPKKNGNPQVDAKNYLILSAKRSRKEQKRYKLGIKMPLKLTIIYKIHNAKLNQPVVE